MRRSKRSNTVTALYRILTCFLLCSRTWENNIETNISYHISSGMSIIWSLEFPQFCPQNSKSDLLIYSKNIQKLSRALFTQNNCRNYFCAYEKIIKYYFDFIIRIQVSSALSPCLLNTSGAVPLFAFSVPSELAAVKVEK